MEIHVLLYSTHLIFYDKKDNNGSFKAEISIENVLKNYVQVCEINMH